MYKNHTVFVVVPCYNEELQVGSVLTTLPSWVDRIIAIDDASSDRTADVIEGLIKLDPRISLIRHKTNEGVGGAIASGYLWARQHRAGITVVMAGDGQMNPEVLPSIIDPVAEDKTDYAKGNRFTTPKSRRRIPKIRLWGNLFLSFCTRIISGYSAISDSQNGYTAMNLRVLQTLDWTKMRKQYGQPNDVLVKLSLHSFRVTDVPHEAVYGVGEKSKMNILKVIFPIAALLLKLAYEKWAYVQKKSPAAAV